ncbi:hypothetical protein O4328_29020 [Rhodococcus opacus]|uniref:Uncharacterized protein n=1 Tax=Rhodococcus opacus TaxID=37919 RepID=A0ABT4NJX4_RHOOP|nr:hypothetical protein [Rhodococcus opacus]MCZ4587684.1 hypothetical protein [Rhodococcus opacus]
MSDEDGYDEGPESSGRSNETSGGLPVAARVLAVLVPIVAVPATIAVTATSLLIVERRRVRGRWWATWAALSFLLGVLVSGSLLGWALQPLRLPAWLIASLVGASLADAASGLGESGATLQDVAMSTAWAAVLGQLLFALPVGFAITAVFTRVRRFKREKLGEIEGPEFSNWRPVGVLDRVRSRRVTEQIRSGHHTIAPTAETIS